MTTLWQAFYSRWKEGCGSRLCPGAKKCLVKGKIPCDLLFVGEAPNIPADVTGEPFTGDIGIIMDDAIKQARAEGFRCAFTNIVGCIPRDPESSAEEIRPPEDAILACRPRLREFIKLCEPRLIMGVGNLAQRALGQMQSEEPFTAPVAAMSHPATVLYARPHNGYAFRQLLDAVARAVADHLIRSP
jgi:DNA polymerase